MQSWERKILLSIALHMAFNFSVGRLTFAKATVYEVCHCDWPDGNMWGLWELIQVLRFISDTGRFMDIYVLADYVYFLSSYNCVMLNHQRVMGQFYHDKKGRSITQKRMLQTKIWTILVFASALWQLLYNMTNLRPFIGTWSV